MGTWIILGVLAVMVVFACRGSLRHIKGQGGCCGGSVPVKRKRKQKLQKKLAVKKMEIEGITCKQCKNRIENALNAVNQVNATVDVNKKQAVVTLGAEISEQQLIDVVEKAGYHVTAIYTV